MLKLNVSKLQHLDNWLTNLYYHLNIYIRSSCSCGYFRFQVTGDNKMELLYYFISLFEVEYKTLYGGT